jgi:hypothetical protein
VAGELDVKSTIYKKHVTKYMSQKVKNAAILILINILLIGGVLLVANYLAEERLPRTRAQFLSVEDAAFYRRYTDEVNHLRDVTFLEKPDHEFNWSRTDYIFTKLGNDKTQVLIQGDSWAEQFVKGLPSFFSAQAFAEQEHLSLFLAGTASYSPSIMQAQYRILRDEFAIKPTVVVGIIDQTDIGDELCRYRNQIDISATGEHIVKPYTSDELVLFHVGLYFRLIDILDAPGNALFKLIKYKIMKFQATSPGGCGHHVLTALAQPLSETDQEYLINRILKYFEEVFKGTDVPKKLILISHFHKKHLLKNYKNDISDIIELAIKKSRHQNKITHLRFTPDVYKNEDLNHIFVEGDAYSHLTNYYHRKIFSARIFQQIKLELSQPSSTSIK